MSEDRTTVAEAVTDILTDLCSVDAVAAAEPTGWHADLWPVLRGSGFTLISVPEELGGSGGDVADACAVVEAVGRFAAAVPVAETSLLGGWALVGAGLEVPGSVFTTVTGHPDDTTAFSRDGAGWRLSGRWRRVPWATQAEHLVVVGEHDGTPVVGLVPTDRLTVQPGANLAGESRDLVTADQVPVDVVGRAAAGITPAGLRLRGALARAASAAGALARVAELTTTYTKERQQFGRPIGRFQAVQRHVVRVSERAVSVAIAAECAAANAAPDPDLVDVAAAKIVAAESSTTAAQAAHQAHGAIGMTKEYALGHFTPRLWSWREEFGSERYWSRLLGHRMLADGADRLYPRISVGQALAGEPA